MTTALEGGEGSASRPGRSLPPGKTRYTLYRRLDGPQGRSGQVRKISPPPGFDPRTVQTIASRYTNWATWPTLYHVHKWYRLKVRCSWMSELFRGILLILCPYFVHIVPIFYSYCAYILLILCPYFVLLCPYFVHFVPIVCLYCAHIFLILCPYFVHIVPIFCSYCAHTLLTSCPYFAHIVPIFCRYSCGGNKIRNIINFR